MKNKTILYALQSAKKNKTKIFSILIDPDKLILDGTQDKMSRINGLNPDLLLVGGSLVDTPSLDEFVVNLKSESNAPVFIFPGSPSQVSQEADGLLFISLISGRNPDLLIGRHVEIAPFLMRSNLEIIPTGYMLVNSGAPTSASYMSNTLPIPSHKWDIALATAQAGQLLGLEAIYMDAGSGADSTIPIKTIEKVANGIDIPLIVGGGIKTDSQRDSVYNAGADMVVMGTAFE